MKKTLVIALAVLFSASAFSQNSAQNKYTSLVDQGKIDEAIVTILNDVLDSTINSLANNSDPYGVFISQKISYKSNTDTSSSLYELPESEILASLNDKLYIGQKFRLCQKEPKSIFLKGKYFYKLGLYPNANEGNNSEFNIYSNRYTFKIRKDGQLKTMFIETAVAVTASKPNNGSISGIVYFHGDNVIEAWDKECRNRGMDGSNAKIELKRLGPGDDRLNSYNKPWEFNNVIDMAYENGFYSISDLTPGVYVPMIKFRGCEHIYNDKEYHSILATESIPDWNHLVRNGKPILDGKCKNIDDADFTSYFCLNNILEGYIYTDSGEIDKTSQKVWLNPLFNTNDLALNQNYTMSENGYYKFTEIPTGTYEIWVEGNKEKKKDIQICNEPQNGETPDITYTIDISSKRKLQYFVIETTIDHEDIYNPQYLGKVGSSPMGMEHTVLKGMRLVEISNQKTTDHGYTYHDAYVEHYPMEDKGEIIEFYSTLYRLNEAQGRWEKYSNDPPEDASMQEAKLIAPYFTEERLFVDSDKFEFPKLANEEMWGYTEGFSDATQRNDNQFVYWSELKNLSARIVIEDQVILETNYTYENNVATSSSSQETLNWLAENSSGDTQTFFNAINGDIKLNVEPSKQIIKRRIVIRPATKAEIKKYLPPKYGY